MGAGPIVPAWVEPLCRIARDWKTGAASIRERFLGAAPDLSDRARFALVVRGRLRSSPDLIGAWQGYSWDKRAAAGPYVDGTEAGFFDGARTVDVRSHGDSAAACADFLYREAVWVIEGRRAIPPARPS